MYILDFAKQYGDVDRLFKQRVNINYLQDARNECMTAFPQAMIKSAKPTKGNKIEKLAEDEEAKEDEYIHTSINPLDLTDSDIKAAVKQAQ